MNTSNKPLLNTSNFYIFAKFFFYGMILGEVWVIAVIIATAVYSKFLATAPAAYLWISILGYAAVILVYIASRWRTITIVFKSYRVDLLATIAAGFFFVYSGGGFKIGYINNLLSALSGGQAAIIAFIPCLIIIILICVHKLEISEKELKETILIDNTEIENTEEDVLGFKEKAHAFADIIYYDSSKGNQVFAIDAPWGTGKSSFVNLCIRHWERNYGVQTIVYKFDILKYEQHNNLTMKFIEGLIRAIEKQVFAPEINSVLKKYRNIISGYTFSVAGLGFNLRDRVESSSSSDLIEILDKELDKINKKIIVIIDDLDRLDADTIKKLLFMMNKAFNMRNISYVLCYDTYNISLDLPNCNSREKTIEFIEKFINVKINLYISVDKLINYCKLSWEKQKQENILIDNADFEKLYTALIGILQNKDYHEQLSLLGDLRKLKKLVNIITILGIQTVNFKIEDFDEQDLVNLLIIYINYPHIFKKICDTELCNTTNYKSFFAVNYEDNKHISSIAYRDYTEALPKTQKFILNKVFAKDKVVGKTDVGELEIATFACFNNYNNYNLKKYLKLILDVQKPENQSYKKYIILRNEILQKENAEQVFTRPDVSSEAAQQLLWRAIVNTPATEFSVEKAKDVIDYAVRSLGNYDYINTSGGSYGFRTTMAHYLVMLLNKIGWNDQNSRFFDSSNQDNVIKIADRIFGNGQPSSINELCNIDKGVMGLNDLLSFRLACCVDRSGDIFNLSRALVLNSEKKETNGMDMGTQLVIGMRPLSQATYSVFSELFKSKNLFDEIDKLELENVISTRFGKQETLENAEYALEKAKCELKGFIVYQLGNKVISSGIGCGFYDLDGREDKHGINKDFNNYLFDVCFNPDLNRDNYYHFLDYMFMNFSRNLTAFGNTNKHSLNISNIKKVLDKELLKKYWQENISNLKNIAESSQDNFVVINDFKLEYSKHFKLLSDGLDKWFSEQDEDVSLDI